MSRSVRSVAVGLVLALGLSACGGVYVYVDSQRYMPRLPAGLEAYNGMPLYLFNVNNQAYDTDSYYYYSRDWYISYETSPELARYVYDNVARAMQSIGMVVYTADPAYLGAGAGIPQMDINILSFNDYELRFMVALSRQFAQIYQNEFVVQIPELVENWDPVALEDRAYQFMDAMVVGILSEPGFQTAYFSQFQQQ